MQPRERGQDQTLAFLNLAENLVLKFVFGDAALAF
jgi:hypothetical protein